MWGVPPKPPPPPPVHHAKTVASLAISVSVLLCVVASVRPAKPAFAARRTVLTHVVAFVINVAAVAVPGRFDSDVTPERMDFPWPTLFAPAGFAFAIWGVIYLGELLGLAMLLRSEAVAARAAPASRAWLGANVAQALWCASFRPWALDRLWLSALCLSATASCLLLSQLRLVQPLTPPSHWRPCKSEPGGAHMSLVGWSLLVAPRSLHCGWTTAATLVNVNAWAGSAAIGPPAALATAIFSLVAGLGLADLYARLGVPTAAVAIAWALFAVGRGEPTGADALALGQPALDGLSLSAGGAAAVALLTIGARELLCPPALARHELRQPAGCESDARPPSRPDGAPETAPRNATDALAFGPRMVSALAFAPAAPEAPRQVDAAR